jgi:hypothetical protein
MNSFRFKKQRYEIIGQFDVETRDMTTATLFQCQSACPTCGSGFVYLATKSAIRKRRLNRRCERCAAMKLGPVGSAKCVAAQARFARARARASSLADSAEIAARP